MRYLEFERYKIRFVSEGKGYPLLLIHGLGASIEWWHPTLQSLSRFYRVMAFDLPGFGLSSKPEISFNFSMIKHFMESLIKALNLERVSLIGNSLGGLISLYAASEMPHRVEKLILAANPGFGRELSVLLRLGSLFPLGEIALSLRNHLAVRLILARMFNDKKRLPHTLLDSVLRMFKRQEVRESFLEVLRSGVERKGLRKEIHELCLEMATSLKQETLIVWGADDKIIPLNQAYTGKALIKNSQLQVLPKCGHVPQIEKAEEFNNLVLRFLGR